MLSNTAQKGFTILEMIIVIFLVSFSLVAIYGAFSVLVILNQDSSDRLEVAYLAQEGLEIIRNIRDANWNNDFPWLQSLDVCQTGCQVDYKTNGTNNLPTTFGQDGNYLDTDSGFYGYSIANPVEITKFKRKITINVINDQNSNSYAVRVFSEVFLTSKPILGLPQNQSIKVETILYDWQ